MRSGGHIRRFLRWPALGALLGGGWGLLFVLISFVAGGSTFAGMLLFASAASFPAGLWVIDLAAKGMEHGAGDLVYAAMIAAPAVNGAAVLGLVGAVIVAVERTRAS